MATESYMYTVHTVPDNTVWLINRYGEHDLVAESIHVGGHVQ